VQAAKTDDGPGDEANSSRCDHDMFARNAKIRSDGRMVHDLYLVQ